MAKYIRMIIVLSAITLISGFALGGLNELTYEKAANNILKFKKILEAEDYVVETNYITKEEAVIMMEEEIGENFVELSSFLLFHPSCRLTI